MIGKTHRRFWKAFEKLPVPIQNLAHEKYTLWKRAPFHPSLHFEERRNGICVVRIGTVIAHSACVKATRLFGSGSERTRNTIVSVFDHCFPCSTLNTLSRRSVGVDGSALNSQLFFRLSKTLPELNAPVSYLIGQFCFKILQSKLCSRLLIAQLPFRNS